jgi:hypothetical protein
LTIKLPNLLIDFDQMVYYPSRDYTKDWRGAPLTPRQSWACSVND